MHGVITLTHIYNNKIDNVTYIVNDISRKPMLNEILYLKEKENIEEN